MISIIMLSYGSNILTRQSIDSILEHTSTDYELIVVDNNSGLLLRDKKYKGIRLIKNRGNPGYARGCNQGAGQAKGGYLLFLNNDTIVTPGWLLAMYQVMLKNEDVGIVGSKLLFPDTGRIQHAGVIFINRLPGHIYYNENPFEVPIEEEKEYPAVTGACLLIRKSLFERVGGFDHLFINSYEDIDLCLKIRGLGYRIIYTPDSLVYHYSSKSPGRHRYDKRNLALLLKKWQGSRLLS
ncbi:MAG: glycosyltransferase family 2 protein [Firmicutes bacterium]|nr:glycosyltransferase family 2 protein [Bacillota bacterium]